MRSRLFSRRRVLVGLNCGVFADFQPAKTPQFKLERGPQAGLKGERINPDIRESGS